MKKTLLTLAALSVCAAGMAQQMTDTDTHSSKLTGVDEYRPAPGQFVNTLPAYDSDDNADSMAVKAFNSIYKGTYITLGAYGGYVIMHFDHSVANLDGNDLLITGNAFPGWGEPGIIMVSKDVNHNGKPDDPWYELRGAADTAIASTIDYNYTITYKFTSDSTRRASTWTDSKGNSGTVALNAFHRQEYFPLWLASDSTLTFHGTLLTSADTVTTAGYAAPKSFDWGYVDNLANNDSHGSKFDISNAVDANRQPVNLDFIDFVKVYTAVNLNQGMMGETSTEVTGCEDLHTDSSVAAIKSYQETIKHVATFDDFMDAEGNTLPADSVYNGADGAGFLASGDYVFTNNYNASWGSWSGFSVSSKTGTTASGYTEQYNSTVGHGYDGSANFAVVYPNMYGVSEGQSEAIEHNDGEAFTATGFYTTLSAYTYNSIMNGDTFSGGKFTTGDWYKITAIGEKVDGTQNKVDFYLADYRSNNEADHYAVTDWSWVDLSSLGTVKKISFWITGSRTGTYGLNTPAYLCMDNFGGSYDGVSKALPVTSGTVTAIGNTEAQQTATVTGIYTTTGVKVDKPVHGINIIRYSNGAVKRVLVK